MPQENLAIATVDVKGENTFPPTFEKPDGYTFSAKEGVVDLSVGFVKVPDMCLEPSLFSCKSMQIYVWGNLMETKINAMVS